jgi:hypothetical protein
MAPLAPAWILAVVAASVVFLVVLDGMKHGMARLSARRPAGAAL